jgi:5-methylcytosine-specific restriction endonuclease McrA
MKQIPAKSPRLRLATDSYRELHRQILKRDDWRCQACGSIQNLQVHHLKLRSHSGGDVEQNLITLCAECHAQAHREAKQGPQRLP